MLMLGCLVEENWSRLMNFEKKFFKNFFHTQKGKENLKGKSLQICIQAV